MVTGEFGHLHKDPLAVSALPLYIAYFHGFENKNVSLVHWMYNKLLFHYSKKWWLKLKKVGKTTRPFRYDLNKIPYDYTVEVMNRFKGLDLVDRVPEELWTEVCWNSYDKPRQHIKKQRHHFANKGPYSQSYSLSSSHVQMWELDHKEGWVPKNWCFWVVVLEKTLESPLNSKEIKPVNSKGNKPWIFIGRTDAEAEAPIL